MLFKCEQCDGMVDSAGCDYGEEIICGHCENAIAVPASLFSKNAIIDDFIIEKFLGKGGMGMVYRAHQISLDRTIALKILTISEDMGPEAVDDFVKEARSAASLNHPHIVQAYAVGKYEDIYYFGMEYVEGQTVKELMDKEPILDEDSTLAIGLNIAEALREAWDRKKIIHRDIKPDNIMLTDEGVVKLMDLGLSCTHNESANESDTITGTPQYICPEQIMGSEMDIRGDLYSLGATMYHMMTGEFCFNGNGYNEILRGHLERDPKPLTEFGRNISEGSWLVIKKLLEKDPNDRYQNAQELIQALHDARAGKTAAPVTLAPPQGLKKPEGLKAPQAKVEKKENTEAQEEVTFTPKKKSAASKKKFIIMGAILGALIIIRVIVSVSTLSEEDKLKLQQQEIAEITAKNKEKQLEKKKAADARKIAEAEKAKKAAQAKKAERAKKAAEAAKKAELTKKAEQQAKARSKPVDLIAPGFLWTYNYTSSKISSSWMKTDYNDKSWKKGSAPLSYGTNKHKAKTSLTKSRNGVGILYLRRKFILQKVDKNLDYRVVHMMDDGGAVWINGNRLFVVNMDAKQLKPGGLAKKENTDTEHKFKGWKTIPHNKLKAGVNVVAVEVHPVAKSPDLFFDLRLVQRPKKKK
ncbi:serine/threonine-protein kinase [Lentisphaera profundi]|uniref:Serine/threonine-protein kinase n=1 Tax=Lentisphaera profundi TaxID=1658616 RepID=A0ABY7VXX6_9BACT|nr:serine/threonine-protein kinase [Lentisphaera profundi]WDE98776.1 serine/threonine-protein kinase [Lentisphaera profundi]